MPPFAHSESFGSPRFSDAHVATIARDLGPIAAWQELVTQNPAASARGVEGDFAVGVHFPDGSSFLAVDRFAIQTLCYRVDEDGLHFAPRADQLATTRTVVDPQAIFDYLYFHVIPAPRTIYQGILRLPPGHYAHWAQGKLTVAPYWVPVFDEIGAPDFAQLEDEFRSLLRAGVARHLGANQPACFLSGGTDSSTIVGMATLASGKGVASYSIGFDAQGYDEMEFARIAARHFKTEHHEYYVTPDDLVRSVPEVAAYFDQPFGNSSVLPAYYCAREARANGVDKMLAGDGGDELFGGNSRYAKQRVFGWYQHAPGFVRNGVLEPLLATGLGRATSLTRKASSYVEQARLPMPDRLQLYNLMTRLGVSDVLTPSIVARVDTGRPLKLQRHVWDAAQNASGLNRELAFDWRFTLADCDLRKVEGATRLAGVDVGFPMLDDALLDFSLKLPTQYKLNGGKLRWFFKEALRGFLPDEILVKKKQGFGLPFGVWTNQTPALRKLASESLDNLATRSVVNRGFVETLMRDRLPEHPGYYGEMVWILMMLEQWLQAKAPSFQVSA